MSISAKWKVDPATGNFVSPTANRIAAPIEVGARSVVGNNTGTKGDSQDIPATVEGGVLSLIGGILGFAKLALSQMANQAAYSALVNTSATAGPPSALAYAANSFIARLGSAAPAAWSGAVSRLVGWDASGVLGALQVTPEMLAPVFKTFEVVTGTATAVGGTVQLSEVAALTKGTWSGVSSYTQLLPSTGIYEVEVDLYPLLTSATNPHDSGVAIYLGTTDVVHICYDSRDNGTANLAVHLYGRKKIRVTDTAQALKLVCLGGAWSGLTNLFSSATTHPNPNRVTITKISDL